MLHAKIVKIALPLLLLLALAACGSPAATAPSAITPAFTANTSVSAATPAPAASAAATRAAATTPAAQATKLNLNTATASDFLKVPNVGNNMVREFQEYRPYVSILQFRREIGKYVDAQTVATFEQYVYVPIDVNQADAATLQQIPGLDAAAAASLIAARPYASNDAFLSRLAQYVSADQVTAAKSLLK